MPQLAPTEGPAPHVPGQPQIALIRLRLPCTTCDYVTGWHASEPDAKAEYSNHTHANDPKEGPQ